MEGIPSGTLIMALKPPGTNSNLVTPVELFGFYRNYRATGISPVLPVISLKEKSFQIDRATVFEKEKAFVAKAWLNPDETEIYNMLADQRPYLTIHAHGTAASYVINVQRVSMKYTIASNNGNPLIRMNVKVAGAIEQALAPIDPTQMKSYERGAEEEVKRRVLPFLQKMRDQRLDPVGLGQHYIARHFDSAKAREDWEAIYPSVQFEIRPQVKLYNTGLLMDNPK